MPHVTELQCGQRLTFATRSAAPRAGDAVPCSRHGWCRAVSVAERVRRADARRTRRRRPRTEDELLKYLRVHGRVTVGELRRNRFTLRLVAALLVSGLIDVETHPDGAARRVRCRP